MVLNASIAFIDSLQDGWRGIPVFDFFFSPFFIQIMHCLNQCHNLLTIEPSLTAYPSPQRFLSFIAMSLGGTAMTSIVLGQPISWLCSDAVMMTYIIAYILAYHSPLQSTYLTMLRFRPLKLLFSTLDDLSCATSISSWGIDRAVSVMASSKSFPQSHSAVAMSLVCGVLSGCGGGLLRMTLNLTDANGWRLSAFPVCFSSSPPLLVRAVVASSFLYYTLSNPHGYLPVTLFPAAQVIGDKSKAQKVKTNGKVLVETVNRVKRQVVEDKSNVEASVEEKSNLAISEAVEFVEAERQSVNETMSSTRSRRPRSANKKNRS